MAKGKAGTAVKMKPDKVVARVGKTKVSTGKPTGVVKNTTKGPGTKKLPKI